jgi:DNA polymerase I
VGARIKGTVHDEIILEVPDEMVENLATILRETMTKAGEAYLSRIPIEVGVTIGETWAEE